MITLLRWLLSTALWAELVASFIVTCIIFAALLSMAVMLS